MNLYDILACPNCRVKPDRHKDYLLCDKCGTTFPIINEVPIMFPDGKTPEIRHQSELSIRETYDPWVHRVILQSLLDDQIVLEIGSGNMALDDPCIIRMDITLSPFVDLVADSHHLPFLPSTIDYIFSLAVVEHLRNPFQAAHSMYEVLKDGGYIYHECNFVFAYHGFPHHYFNVSLQGMEQIFSQFIALRKGIAAYQMPSFALKMILQTYLQKSHAHEYPHGLHLSQMIQKLLALDLTQYDIYFSEEEAHYIAAGTYFSGMKQVTPQSTLIPAIIVDIYQKDEELKQRFPNISQLTTTENVLVWAKTEGRIKYPEIAVYLDSIKTFDKRDTLTTSSRQKIHSLPFQEPLFGAIGFDPSLSMAENAQIAWLRHPYRGQPIPIPNMPLLSKGLEVLMSEGIWNFIKRAALYLPHKVQKKLERRLPLNKTRPQSGSLTQELFHYKGFDIPVNLLLLTGGGPDTFDKISRAHIRNIETFVGLKPNYSVLEIGCGIGRDAIPLTKRLSKDGKYLGIDIIGPSIEWCKKNISRKFPNFNFIHFDVQDQLHNPNGTISTLDVHIPLESGTVDLIILQSVFTHLLRADIVHYLNEFRGLLKPSGYVYATMFIVNDLILASARATNLTPFNLTFEHEIDEGCRINDPLYPTGAVAYTSQALEEMLDEAGLKLARPLLKGAWSGYYPDADDGQDVAILALA